MDEDPASPSLWQTYRLPIICGGISGVFLLLTIIFLVKSFQTTEPIQFHQKEGYASSSARSRTITIDIEGAVKAPGVYVLPEGSRIEDGIQNAGGVTIHADIDRIQRTINRASLLTDGAKIYIPEKGEVTTATTPVLAQPFGMNINTASPKELDALPGVGEVTAEKIIAGRPYQTLDELVTRKIVTQSVFEKIKAQLSL